MPLIWLMPDCAQCGGASGWWSGSVVDVAFVCLMSLDFPTSAAVDIGVSRYRWRRCCLFCAYHRGCVLSFAQPPALTQGASQPASVASGLASAYNMFMGVHFVGCKNSVWPRRSIQLRLLYIPYHYNVYHVHLLYFHIGHITGTWLQAFLQYSQYSLSFCPSLWWRHRLHISFFISTFLFRSICHIICRINLGCITHRLLDANCK